MNFTEWNHGLLLSVVLVIVGGMLLVGASSLRQRLIAVGTLSQAIVLAFVANGAFHGRSDLPLAAIVLASLVALWSLLIARESSDGETAREAGFAEDAVIGRAAMLKDSNQVPDDLSRAVEEQ